MEKRNHGKQDTVPFIYEQIFIKYGTPAPISNKQHSNPALRSVTVVVFIFIHFNRRSIMPPVMAALVETRVKFV